MNYRSFRIPPQGRKKGRRGGEKKSFTASFPPKKKKPKKKRRREGKGITARSAHSPTTRPDELWGEEKGKRRNVHSPKKGKRERVLRNSGRRGTRKKKRTGAESAGAQTPKKKKKKKKKNDEEILIPAVLPYK